MSLFKNKRGWRMRQFFFRPSPVDVDTGRRALENIKETQLLQHTSANFLGNYVSFVNSSGAQLVPTTTIKMHYWDRISMLNKYRNQKMGVMDFASIREFIDHQSLGMWHDNTFSQRLYYMLSFGDEWELMDQGSPMVEAQQNDEQQRSNGASETETQTLILDSTPNEQIIDPIRLEGRGT